MKGRHELQITGDYARVCDSYRSSKDVCVAVVFGGVATLESVVTKIQKSEPNFVLGVFSLRVRAVHGVAAYSRKT
jgi:hypothetical protein